MYTITLGQDVPCYATIRLPEGVALTREALHRVARRIEETGECDGQAVQFDPSWTDAAALRVVAVQDANGNTVAEDIPVEPSPFDAGQALQNWLNGHGPDLPSVIRAAAEFGLIPQPVMAERRWALALPDGGSVEVAFACRSAATPEELDLAFVHALAQVAEIEDLTDAPSTHET